MRVDFRIEDGTLILKRESNRGSFSYRISIPAEVEEWIRCGDNLRYLKLLCNTMFNRRLANPRAVRSLIYLLYAEAYSIPPYKIAEKMGIQKEQLYRHRRALRKEGLYEAVVSILSKCK
ncbi:MAG: hypothetical protein LRS47_02110 [Desulfurococcales archaeon]|nr:hypothetical protein [Desulfurococcales archaeon]